MLRDTVTLAGRRVSAFRFCGVVGFACACFVAFALTAARDRSVGVEALLIVVAVAVFFALAFATLWTTGRENLVYYHHEIAVLCCVAAVAALLGAPVLAHLDATALGLGAFLACGRVGCTLAGCCHGRPARRGLRYPEFYADVGPPAFLIGVPLVPVQLIEAAGAAALVCAGSVSVLAGAAPGVGFALYVTGYGVLRFALETQRGDLRRPHWRGVSAAQWTSLLVCAVIVALGAAGVLEASPLHVAALVLVACGTAAIALGLFPRPRHLLGPRHVHELHARLTALQAPGEPVATARTVASVRVSRGKLPGAEHYALSRDGEPLTAEEIRQLTGLIGWLRHPRARVQVIAGAAGVAHVTFRSPDAEVAPGSKAG
jgi:hypothetical protein